MSFQKVLMDTWFAHNIDGYDVNSGFESIKPILKAGSGDSIEGYFSALGSGATLMGDFGNILPNILAQDYTLWMQVNGTDTVLPTCFTIKGLVNISTTSFPDTLLAGYRYVAFHLSSDFNITNFNATWKTYDNTMSEPDSDIFSATADGWVTALHPFNGTSYTLRASIEPKWDGENLGTAQVTVTVDAVESPVQALVDESGAVLSTETKLFAFKSDDYGGVRNINYSFGVSVKNSGNQDITSSFGIRIENDGVYVTPKVKTNQQSVKFLFYLQTAGEDPIWIDTHTLTLTCDPPEPPQNPVIPHAVFPFAAKTVLAVGESVQLYVPGETITYAASSHPAVAFATGDGRVTGVAPGAATIYVQTSEGGSGSIVMTVTAKDVELSGKKTIQVGETAQLTLPEGETIASAESSNPAVLAVDAGGSYTGVKPGTATITVHTASGRTGTFPVTVEKPSHARTLKVGQTLTLKVKGKTIVSAELKEDNGAITVTNSGKIAALSAGRDTAILTTEDGKTLRVTVTVEERPGKVSLKSGSLRLRKSPNGSTIAYLKNGQSVTILALEGSYYRVQATVNGRIVTGYAAKAYIKK